MSVSAPTSSSLDSTQETSSKLTRKQIYQRIQETSKDEVILEEMIRLGFWNPENRAPQLTPEFIAKRAEIWRKLCELGETQRLYADPEKALQALHKKRKKAALEKREQTRRLRNQRRYEKSLAWHHKQQTGIHYLGADYSFGLQQLEADLDRLNAQSLPLLENSSMLARAMGIAINELRFLCFQKEVSTVHHYQLFEINKKSGGTRRISAPMPRLKHAQYWILDNILQRIPLHPAAHGFVCGKSILSNALPHVGRAVVINLDMQDFFPSIHYRRVKGMFCKLGYAEHVATHLALLTTESAVEVLTLDQETWYVQNGERFLPQGAPTSPAISNLLCRRLDARLQGMAQKVGFQYTRYADDVSFSGDDPTQVQKLLWRCKQIIEDEGFIIHPNKTRVMRQHQHQEVTGVVVNQKPAVDRKTLRQFRALLFQIEKDGIEGKQWRTGDLFASIEGYAQFVSMIAPEKGIPLQKQIAQIKRKYGLQVVHGRITALNKRLFRLRAAKGELPRQEWWQTQISSPPQLELTPQQKAEAKVAAKAAVDLAPPTTAATMIGAAEAKEAKPLGFNLKRFTVCEYAKETAAPCITSIEKKYPNDLEYRDSIDLDDFKVAIAKTLIY